MLRLKNDFHTRVTAPYPRLHREMAVQMTSQGGLLTEFMSRTNADKENFVRRNRIVAGMADATIVVELRKAAH